MNDSTFPAVNPAEKRELERLAGREFLRLEQLYAFRKRQLNADALEEVLATTRNENRRRSRRD